MIEQRTIKTLIKAKGISLHSGECTEITFRPALPNTGVIFRRVDLDEPADIPATATNVQDTTLNTTIVKDGVGVSTVEHLMSALSALGIDNIYIDINSAEVPIMDGSAAPFIFLIQSAGIEPQGVPKRFIRIKESVCVKEGDRWARFEPYEGFRVAFTIDFDHPLFQSQSQTAALDFSTLSFVKEVSRARTFGFLSEFEYLRERGLAKGASLDNAIAVGDYHILNKDGLRYKDEFVKHKILDAVGDLFLLGSNIIGAYEGFKSGHALNNTLARELLASEGAWEYVTYEDDAQVVPSSYSGLVTSHQ